MKKMFRNTCALFIFSVVSFLIFVPIKSVHGQSIKKFSIGYDLKTYSYSFLTSENYADQLGAVRKGFLTLNYTSDISDSFYFDISGDFLIPQRDTPLSNGPLSFNAASAGLSIGARVGSKVGITAGFQGGVLWNMRIKTEPGSDNLQWIRPEQPQTNLNGSVTGGLRYHILNYLTAKVSVSKSFYQYSIINPRSRPAAFNEADLSSYSARAGFSLDIPWQANFGTNREPTYRRGAPIVEDRHFSLGYEMRGYTYSFFPNSTFTGNVGLIRKGFLRAQYTHYLSKHIFLKASGGYLVPKQAGSFFSSGPIDFQGGNFDLQAGIRWGRVSLFSGFEGGLLWDMRIKSMNQAGDVTWNAPADNRSSFTGAFKGGIEYHLFKYLSLKAKFFYNSYQHSEVTPDLSVPEAPSVNTAELAPFSAGFGISISIPWKSRGNRGAPPPRRTPSPTPTPGPTEKEEVTTETEPQKEVPPIVTRPPDSTPAQIRFTNPIPARKIMTSDFGDDREHEGLDINAETGDDILSVARGTVIDAGFAGGYGKQVKVEHPGGFVSIYAHLSEIAVDEGQEVDTGTRLGAAGNSGFSTGPHLHFELLRMNLPINPRRYIIHDWEPWNTGQ